MRAAPAPAAAPLVLSERPRRRTAVGLVYKARAPQRSTDMPSTSSILVGASAFVILCLGCVHLLLTFRGNKLHPRDRALIGHLAGAPLVITRETNMWKAWIGFNASHSYGAILFGLVYGHLALHDPAMLFGSPFLLAVGLAMLLGYVFLAWRYWFTVPFFGVVLATVLYISALLASLSV